MLLNCVLKTEAGANVGLPCVPFFCTIIGIRDCSFFFVCLFRCFLVCVCRLRQENAHIVHAARQPASAPRSAESAAADVVGFLRCAHRRHKIDYHEQDFYVVVSFVGYFFCVFPFYEEFKENTHNTQHFNANQRILTRLI